MNYEKQMCICVDKCLILFNQLVNKLTNDKYRRIYLWFVAQY